MEAYTKGRIYQGGSSQPLQLHRWAAGGHPAVQTPETPEVLMEGVCCWEQKFDWGGGGGSWCWRPRKLGQAGFLEGAVGCNVA